MIVNFLSLLYSYYYCYFNVGLSELIQKFLKVIKALKIKSDEDSKMLCFEKASHFKILPPLLDMQI